MERGAFRRNLIGGKYGEEGEWHFKEVRDSYGVSLWKAIRKE